MRRLRGKAGAAAYIIKGMNYDRLIQGIRRVHAGKTYVPPEVSRAVNERPGSDFERTRKRGPHLDSSGDEQPRHR
jgi:DNA-binding NarL/FixJ family response regulator